MNKLEFNMLLKTIKSDECSLVKLYNFYFPKIVYFIGCKYGKSFAEDVAQEFFCKLLERNDVEYVRNPLAWVLLKSDSIAKRKMTVENRYIALNDAPESGENPLEKELYGELYSALEILDGMEKEILKLYYWIGYSLKETSEILGVNYDTVRQKHIRLKKKLKKYLIENGIKL